MSPRFLKFLAALFALRASMAFGFEAAIAERSLWKSTRATMGEWGFLAALHRAKTECEASRPEGRALVSANFRRDYFGKLVIDGEAGVVTASGEMDRSELGNRVNSFEFCGATLRPLPGWHAPKDGLEYLTQELKDTSGGRAHYIEVEREFQGVKFHFVGATSRPEMTEAIKGVRNGSVVRIEMVALAVRDSEIFGLLTWVAEADRPAGDLAPASDPPKRAEAPVAAPRKPRFAQMARGGAISEPDRSDSGESIVIRLHDTFTLRVGQEARLGANGPVFRLADVDDDSRCPPTSPCGGKARVRLAVVPKGVPEQSVIFEVPPTPKSEQWVGVFRIRMTHLDPRPFSREKIDKKDYRAEMVVDLGPIKNQDPKKPKKAPDSRYIQWGWDWDWYPAEGDYPETWE